MRKRVKLSLSLSYVRVSRRALPIFVPMFLFQSSTRRFIGSSALLGSPVSAAHSLVAFRLLVLAGTSGAARVTGDLERHYKQKLPPAFVRAHEYLNKKVEFPALLAATFPISANRPNYSRRRRGWSLRQLRSG